MFANASRISPCRVTTLATTALLACVFAAPASAQLKTLRFAIRDGVFSDALRYAAPD